MTFSGFPLIKVFLFLALVVSLVVTSRFLKAYAVNVSDQDAIRYNFTNSQFQAGQECSEIEGQSVCVPVEGGGGGSGDPEPEPVNLTSCPASIYKGQSTNAIRVTGGSGDYELSKNPNVGTLSRSGAVVTYSVPANATANSVTLTAEDEDDHDNDDSCTITINNPPPVDLTCPSSAIMTPGQAVSFSVSGGLPGTSYIFGIDSSVAGITYSFNSATRNLSAPSNAPVGSTVTVTASDSTNIANQDSCSIQIVEGLNVPNCPTLSGFTQNGLGYTPTQGGPQTYQFQKTGDCGAAGCEWELEVFRNGVQIEDNKGSVNSDTGFYTKGSGVTNNDQIMVILSGATPGVSCGFFLHRERLIELPANQSPIMIEGNPVELQYSGGPSNRNFVRWELLAGPGSLNADTGVYTPSDDYDDLETPISIKVIDEVFPTNHATQTFTYTSPPCQDNFGIYDYHGNSVALQDQSVTKGVYPGVTYRFFVKNAVVPGTFEMNNFEPLAQAAAIPLDVHQGTSSEGMPYFDFQFGGGSAERGHSFGFSVWDPNTNDGEHTCKVNLEFEHRGSKLRAKNPRRVRMNNH